MAGQEKSALNGGQGQDPGISAVSVRGFKSLARESRIEIRPLTILAGANSAGKSSMMQPLLLLKQTLQASYDAGPLLLNGPNARHTSFDQLVSRTLTDPDDRVLAFGLEADDMSIVITFAPGDDHSVTIRSMTTSVLVDGKTRSLHLEPGFDGKQVKDALSAFAPELGGRLESAYEGAQLALYRDRCILLPGFESLDGSRSVTIPVHFTAVPVRNLHRLIHVPGVRGNPDRSYPRTTSGPDFPGTFPIYVATIIADWQRTGDPRKMLLEKTLADLGLTGEIATKGGDEAQIELHVGRLPSEASDQMDLVNIADVGFGVSQVLPVLVALLTADEGQLVYVEQPELHLHPLAEYRLAQFLAETARRGPRLVVETHSALLLLHLRTLIARGELEPDLVKLHWFARDPADGMTSIRSADLDSEGAFGAWPEDFGDVDLHAEAAYLNAVEQRSTN